MLDIKFIYMFLGFLTAIVSIGAIVNPQSFKKNIKPLCTDPNYLRSASIWYLFLGSLMAYYGWQTPIYRASYIVFVIGLLFMVNGIFMIFNTKEYQELFVNRFFKLDDKKLRICGIIKFIVALLFLYYGFFFF